MNSLKQMPREIAEFSFQARDVLVHGQLCRRAHVDGDGYKFLADPESAIAALRRSNERADLFKFLQKLPETSPRYPYPFEWDNLAVLPISTLDHWWSQQIGFKARNKAKQAEKKGIVVREVLFGRVLVPGIGKLAVPQQEGVTRR
jgi:hypothetical protein